MATYTVVGPDAATARLTLTGDDAGDFSLSSGDLSFRSSPNYEAPADVDGNNVYELTLEANDGTYMASRTVSVTVTNVDELGTLAGDASLTYAEGGDGCGVGTYAITGGDGSAISLEPGQLVADGRRQFTLDFNISTSRHAHLRLQLPTTRCPWTEDDGDNTYKVTVKAEAGGEDGYGGCHRRLSPTRTRTGW